MNEVKLWTTPETRILKTVGYIVELQKKWKLRHDFLPDKNGVRVSETKDCFYVDLEQIGGLMFEVLII